MHGIYFGCQVFATNEDYPTWMYYKQKGGLRSGQSMLQENK